MRRTLKMLCLVVALVMLLATPAWADSQPDAGVNSQGRNEIAFFEGPHCHTNSVANENQSAFDEISAYPSHNAHIQTNIRLGGNAIFTADTTSPGCELE